MNVRARPGSIFLIRLEETLYENELQAELFQHSVDERNPEFYFNPIKPQLSSNGFFSNQ
jgi:hypothetical protein